MHRNELAAATLVAAFAGAAYAADQISDRLIAAPGSIERASALDTTSYTSIGRLYFNTTGATAFAPGATSFIRFWNSSGQSTDFDAKIVGGESGTDYAPGKTYRITVPDKASLQRSLEDIRAGIVSQGGPDIAPHGGDTFVTLYVKNVKAGAGVGFQHVSFSGATGFFENQSICTFDPAQDYAANNRRLINVHTSQLAGYPSRIEVRNPDAAARAVRGRVYDAVTGTSLGAFSVNPPANGSAVIDFPAVEQIIGFRPSASQLQVNIEFEAADTSAYTAIVGHTMAQTSTGAAFNLTQACAINPPRSTSACASVNPSGQPSNAGDCASGVPVANNDTLTQTLIAGSLVQIPHATLLANDTNASGATVYGVSPLKDAAGIMNGDFGPGATAISFTPLRPGTMTFTYNLKNAAGYSGYATVTMTVNPSGTPVGAKPTAVNDTITPTFKAGQQYVINLSTLTANDTLPALTAPATAYVFGGISDFVDAGTSTINGGYLVYDNTISWWPERPGQVTFSYMVRGNTVVSTDSNVATVTLTVVP